MSSPITTTVQVQTFPQTALVDASRANTGPTRPSSPSQIIQGRFACVTTALAQLQPSRQDKREASLLNKIDRLLTKLTNLVDAFTKLARSPVFKSAQALDTAPSTPKITGTPTDTAAAETSVEPSDFAPQIPESPAPAILEEPALPTPIPTPEVTSDGINTDRGPIDLGSVLRATGQFLWKPVSEKDGRLAILLPPSLTGKVKEVCILKPDGSRALQRGQSAGVGNGDREHFRFSKAGGEFPDGSIVLVKLTNGTNFHVRISETSNRVTR